MILTGKKGVIFGASNKYSIAWGIAKQLHLHGAEFILSVENEKSINKLKKLMEEHSIKTDICICDVTDETSISNLKNAVASKFEKIDFVVHSIAYAPPESLQNSLINTKWEHFAQTLHISTYSLINIIREFKDILSENSSIITLSFLGSNRIVPGYDIMGIAKAALESSVKYLSHNLSSSNTRVNALSPSPINTVSARGVKNLKEMMHKVSDLSLLKDEINIDTVGTNAVYLLSDLSKGVTGQIIFVDSGYHNLGVL